MGRYIRVMFLLLSCVLLTGCDKKMPEIVFMYESYEMNSEWYESCIIDKEGNIYYTDEKEVFDYTSQELTDMYKEGTLDEEMEHIGSVEVEELQDMYNLYKDVVDSKYNLTSDGMCVDGIVLQKFWYGVSYGGKGVVESDFIYQDGNADHYPSDERAWDIVSWMNEVMGVETMTQPSK